MGRKIESEDLDTEEKSILKKKKLRYKAVYKKRYREKWFNEIGTESLFDLNTIPLLFSNLIMITYDQLLGNTNWIHGSNC